MSAQIPNPCLEYVKRTVPGPISPLLQAWAAKLCSWNFPQENVAHFVYEILYGSDEGGGDDAERQRLHEKIVEEITKGDHKSALAALIALAAADPRWDLWLLICNWVMKAHPSRAQELLLVLLARHRTRPFSGLNEAMDLGDEWISNNPPRPYRGKQP